MAPLFVLFLLALLNPAPSRIGLKAFGRRELLVIYAIVLLGSPLVSHGVLPWLLPYNIAQQRITHERLSFPIAQVPLELVQPGPSACGGARLPTNWPFWIGLIIPCAIGLVSKASGLVPAIPSIPISGATLIQAQGTGPFAGVGAIVFDLTPWEIAIAYLIPKELSFSCWFFWFVRVALTVTAIAFGATPESPEGWYGSGFPAPHHQGGGAVLALSLWTLWIARRHLLRAARVASSSRSHRADAEAPLAYRWAMLGFIASFTYLVCFCIAAGARPLVAAAMVGLIVTYYVM